MRVLALDLSTHTGYALFEGEKGTKPKLLQHGTVDYDKKLFDLGPYPHAYWKSSQRMAALIHFQVSHADVPVDVIVIEEINGGRDRYVQKWLENIHTAVLQHFNGFWPKTNIVYLNSDGATGWRPNLGLRLTKDQKKANAKLSKAKPHPQSQRQQRRRCHLPRHGLLQQRCTLRRSPVSNEQGMEQSREGHVQEDLREEAGR
jgi:hypothetical protein